MTLFTSLRTGLLALQANMSALQTTGHNIANANTEGFSRQRVHMETMPPHDMVFAQLGLGVRVGRIERIVDETLTLHIQSGMSSLHDLSVREDIFTRVETVVNELSDEDLSAALDDFFRSLEELANQPENSATRSVVLENGETLAGRVRAMASSLREIRGQVDDQVIEVVSEINRLAGEIAELNRQIVSAENGGLNPDAANDLRDRRDLLMKQMSQFVKIKPIETSTGAVNILVGSNYVVYDRGSFDVEMNQATDRENVVTTPYFADSGAKLDVLDGQMRGLVEGRDEILGGLVDDLDTLARTLANEMNRIHAEGAAPTRLSDVTSVESVPPDTIAQAPLVTAGTITSAQTDTVFFDSSLTSYAEDYFVGLDVLVTSGRNAGMRRRIVDFSSGRGGIVLDQAFPHDLEVGDTYQITGLPFEVQNGSFELRVVNEQTGQTKTFHIQVDLNRAPTPPPPDPRDSTLQSIVDEINTEVGALFPDVSAAITVDDRLRIRSTSANLTFQFANDSSGFLAAIGMNTFFTGAKASTLELNPFLQGHPDRIAAGLSLAQGDNRNALRMAQLREETVLGNGTQTIEDFWQTVVGRIGSNRAEMSDRVANQQALTEQMENERQRLSGVNLDEEAVNLITFQRAFQGAARFINVVDQLLDTLINRT